MALSGLCYHTLARTCTHTHTNIPLNDKIAYNAGIVLGWSCLQSSPYTPECIRHILQRSGLPPLQYNPSALTLLDFCRWKPWVSVTDSSCYSMFARSHIRDLLYIAEHVPWTTVYKVCLKSCQRLPGSIQKQTPTTATFTLRETYLSCSTNNHAVWRLGCTDGLGYCGFGGNVCITAIEAEIV